MYEILLKIILIASLLANSARLPTAASGEKDTLMPMAAKLIIKQEEESLILRCVTLNELVFPNKLIFQPLNGIVLDNEFLIAPPKRPGGFKRICMPPMLFEDPYNGKPIAFIGYAHWGFSVLLPVGDGIEIFTNKSDNCPLVVMLLYNETDKKFYKLLSHPYSIFKTIEILNVIKELKAIGFTPTDIIFSIRDTALGIKKLKSQLQKFLGDSKEIKIFPRISSDKEETCALVNDSGYTFISKDKSELDKQARTIYSDVWKFRDIINKDYSPKSSSPGKMEPGWPEKVWGAVNELVIEKAKLMMYPHFAEYLSEKLGIDIMFLDTRWLAENGIPLHKLNQNLLFILTKDEYRELLYDCEVGKDKLEICGIKGPGVCIMKDVQIWPCFHPTMRQRRVLIYSMSSANI